MCIAVRSRGELINNCDVANGGAWEEDYVVL